MATGVESSSPEKLVGGIVLDFSVSDDSTVSSSSSPSPFSSSSHPRLPRRLRKRLLESKTPSTIEEIEAKLRHAELRRQQFYEKLSSKARAKPRSPTRSSSNEDDLGQRLEAKLQAAEQKRLSILRNAQMRLARLDELRQAAKSGVEMRFERERERLGTKVELRVQQAEANRMLILKARKQRRATLKERTSQSLSRRIARESKYKERVRAAIHQKRLAAEKKRLGLLEAEKRRARARVLQVLHVANSISHQREVERRRLRDQLEDRLQRAKRQRAEYLRKRGRQYNSSPVNSNRMRSQADLLSRKLARCWRRFRRSRRTTLDLAREYDSLKINLTSIKSMPFEQLAHLIESSATLQTVKCLLDRLESRFKASRAIFASNSSSSLDNIDHLLKRVATPKKRSTPRTSMRSRESKKVGAIRETARGPAKSSRYPVRVVLCAYMIVSHPDAVFSTQGEREIALTRFAEEFIREFELLIRIILDGRIESSDEESDSMSAKRCTFRSQLAAFDKVWCSYLNCFVVWKVKDAQSLEEDLVRAACQLELSMMKKCKLTPGGDNDMLTHDLKAIQKQVTDDQKLLREKVQHLSGVAGIERMESALSETRSKYFEAVEKGSPAGSLITHSLTSTINSLTDPSPASTSDGTSNVVEGVEKPSRVVRSLFREDDQSSSAQKLMLDNELIVNEFLHEQHHGFIERFSARDDDQNDIKVKIRKTMEKAFWDSIMDSVKQDAPDYDRVVQLVREVRDEICEMAPDSWKQEIIETVDLDILSQVLRSGELDINYLGKILGFTLITLQKLSSPAHEDEIKVKHQELLKELLETCQTRDESKCSHATAMIKGLRFVLEQIQVLKQEISKTRIRMMEPLLKGPAGFDYLKKAFASRYGSHLGDSTTLPLTMQWLLSVRSCVDQEWEEHNTSLSALMNNENSSKGFLPSTTLRTGGNFRVETNGGEIISSTSDIREQPEPECSGERTDLLVRLGLLKLATGISGVTQATLPETFTLNLSRLRLIQSKIQKIIVISTSILVCRQTLLMEQMVTSSSEMDGILSKCTEQLWDELDRNDNMGIEEIVEIISGFSQSEDPNKLQSRKVVIARMLAKSLQAGDPVFEKVSRAVYLAARGVVLGGSGPQGRKLAEAALRQVGAVMLTERTVEAAKTMVVMATVSLGIHRAWYVKMTQQM